MQRHYPEIKERGAEVLAISTDNLNGAEQIVRRASMGIEFPILYTSKDPAIPKAYNVFNLHNDGLASASIFIIDKNGDIIYQNIGRRYSHQIAGTTVLNNLP